jgi:ABC-type amino acid transport substrate-binding protein
MKKCTFVLLALLCATPALAADAPPESAYDRVMRTGTIRCAWATASKYVFKDAATGKISGPAPDLMEQLGATLSLKVEWMAEVGYADFAEGLKTGRYDAFCGALSIVPPRARAALFTMPTVYMPMFLYTAEGDARFHSVDDANKPGVKAGTIDGEAFQFATRRYLPKATEYSKPNMTPQGDMLVDVANGKADVAIYDPIAARDYNRNNPKKVSRVSPHPVEVAPWGFAVAPGEHKLVDLLNVGIMNMHMRGMIDRIFNDHDMGPHLVYRAAPMYEAR